MARPWLRNAFRNALDSPVFRAVSGGDGVTVGRVRGRRARTSEKGCSVNQGLYTVYAQNAYRYPLCVRRAAPVPGGAASGLPRFAEDLRAGAEGRLGRLGARSTLRDDGRRNDRDRASASDPLPSRGPGIQAAGGTSAALVR